MAEWADIAACYRWLHDKTEKKYSLKNSWITIPVIILSTLTGTANFALGSFTSNSGANNYAQAGIGAISIFAGILTTLGNFFKYAQNSESNRVASIAWGKFQRLLAVELAISPDDRIDAMDFLKICRNDLDRLIEQSPQLPDDVIHAFEKEFSDMPNLKRPDVAHGLEHTRIFDSSKVRLNRIAGDAALYLKTKKRMMRDEILPDLNVIIHRKIEETLGQMERKGDWNTILARERGRSLPQNPLYPSMRVVAAAITTPTATPVATEAGVHVDIAPTS
jgi:hypothetical protein